jgi:hypothetical protein
MVSSMVLLFGDFMGNIHAYDPTISRSFDHILPWNKLTWVCCTIIELISTNKSRIGESRAKIYVFLKLKFVIFRIDVVL